MRIVRRLWETSALRNLPLEAWDFLGAWKRAGWAYATKRAEVDE